VKSFLNPLLCCSLTLALFACGGGGDSPSGPPSPGATAFAERSCAQCHGANGTGAFPLGPDLTDKGVHWDAERLGEYLADPQAFAAKDPRLGGKNMPALPGDVDAEEHEALIAHVLSLMDPGS
jgi:cytochrome c2